MIRYLLVGLLAWLGLCMPVFAVTISPLVVEMNTDHRLTSQLVITNNATQKLALEASAHELIFQDNGKMDTLIQPDESLLIFPPAALLEPGQQQTFRIQWTSDKPLLTSKSYFIRFSTAHLNQDSNKITQSKLSKGINIQLHYNALLHIYSSAQQPNITIHIDENGTLTLINSGDRCTLTTALFFKA